MKKIEILIFLWIDFMCVLNAKATPSPLHIAQNIESEAILKLQSGLQKDLYNDRCDSAECGVNCDGYCIRDAQCRKSGRAEDEITEERDISESKKLKIVSTNGAQSFCLCRRSASRVENSDCYTYNNQPRPASEGGDASQVSAYQICQGVCSDRVESLSLERNFNESKGFELPRVYAALCDNRRDGGLHRYCYCVGFQYQPNHGWGSPGGWSAPSGWTGGHNSSQPIGWTNQPQNPPTNGWVSQPPPSGGSPPPSGGSPPPPSSNPPSNGWSNPQPPSGGSPPITPSNLTPNGWSNPQPPSGGPSSPNGWSNPQPPSGGSSSPNGWSNPQPPSGGSSSTNGWSNPQLPSGGSISPNGWSNPPPILGTMPTPSNPSPNGWNNQQPPSGGTQNPPPANGWTNVPPVQTQPPSTGWNGYPPVVETQPPASGWLSHPPPVGENPPIPNGWINQPPVMEPPSQNGWSHPTLVVDPPPPTGWTNHPSPMAEHPPQNGWNSNTQGTLDTVPSQQSPNGEQTPDGHMSQTGWGQNGWHSGWNSASNGWSGGTRPQYEVEDDEQVNFESSPQKKPTVPQQQSSNKIPEKGNVEPPNKAPTSPHSLNHNFIPPKFTNKKPTGASSSHTVSSSPVDNEEETFSSSYSQAPSKVPRP